MASAKQTDTDTEDTSIPEYDEEEVSHSTFFKQFSGHTARRVGEKIRAEDGGRGPVRNPYKTQHKNSVMISVHSPLFAFDSTSKRHHQQQHKQSSPSTDSNSNSTNNNSNKFWRWENQLNLNRDNLWEILDWAQSQPGVRWCKQTLYQHRSQKTVHAADNRSWFAQIPWRESFLSDPMYHRLLAGRKEYSQLCTPKLKLVRPVRAKSKHHMLCTCCRPETVNATLHFKPEQKVTHIVSAGLNLTSNYQLALDNYCTCLLTPRDPSQQQYMITKLTIRTNRSTKPILIDCCAADVHKLPEEAHHCISIEAGNYLKGSLHGATEDATADERFSQGTFRGPLRIYFGAIRSMNWAVNRTGQEQVRHKRQGKKFGGDFAGPREVSSRGLRREIKNDITQDLSALDPLTELNEDEEEENDDDYEAEEYTEQGEEAAEEDYQDDYQEEAEAEEAYEEVQAHTSINEEEKKQSPQSSDELPDTQTIPITRNSSTESKHSSTSSAVLIDIDSTASDNLVFRGVSSPPMPPSSPPIDGPARCWIAPASPLPPSVAGDASSQPGSESSYDFVREFDTASLDQADDHQFDLE